MLPPPVVPPAIVFVSVKRSTVSPVLLRKKPEHTPGSLFTSITANPGAFAERERHQQVRCEPGDHLAADADDLVVVLRVEVFVYAFREFWSTRPPCKR